MMCGVDTQAISAERQKNILSLEVKGKIYTRNLFNRDSY